MHGAAPGRERAGEENASMQRDDKRVPLGAAVMWINASRRGERGHALCQPPDCVQGLPETMPGRYGARALSIGVSTDPSSPYTPGPTFPSNTSKARAPGAGSAWRPRQRFVPAERATVSGTPGSFDRESGAQQLVQFGGRLPPIPAPPCGRARLLNRACLSFSVRVRFAPKWFAPSSARILCVTMPVPTPCQALFSSASTNRGPNAHASQGSSLRERDARRAAANDRGEGPCRTRERQHSRGA